MTLLLGSLGIACALLSAAPAAERKVVLEVDHTPLLEKQIARAAEETLFFVRDDSTKLLREKHGITAQEEADPTLDAIIVRLSWINYEDSQYRVVVSTRRTGEQAQVVEEFECECVGSELWGAILERLPAAVEQLDEEPEPEPEPEPAAPEVQLRGSGSDEGDATPSEPEPAERKRKPLGVLGKAGIGVGAAGVVGLVAGGVVFSQGKPFDDPTGNAQVRDGSDFETPGVVVMAAGSAALLTGVALLVVDRLRPRTNGRGPSAAVLPTPGGMMLSGRF
ncbi:MAG: hypothetical protein AAGF11_20960 [Myxococcota bacterium]